MNIDLTYLSADVHAKYLSMCSYIEFFKLINKGANGVVLIGKNIITEKDIAVKFYYWGGGGDHAEPSLLAKMSSENILKVLHAESIDDNYAYFMTPYCENGDLDDAMESRRFGPVEALDIIVQLSSGASYLHGSGYLHRDLKPPNIFVFSPGNYVIGDFGSVVAQNQEGYARTLTRHSLLYRPPEEIKEKRSYRHGDVYQLGLVFFQLLGGALPYNERDWLSNKQKSHYDNLTHPENQFYASDIIETTICAGKLVNLSSLPAWVPKKLISIVRKCCSISFDKRYESAADLSAKLNNIRKTLADWRIGEYPILHRKKKKFRVVQGRKHFMIEKQVVSGWRTERSYSPITMAQAVEITEKL